MEVERWALWRGRPEPAVGRLRVCLGQVPWLRCQADTGSQQGAGSAGAAAPRSPSRSRCPEGWGCWGTSCGCPGLCL